MPILPPATWRPLGFDFVIAWCHAWTRLDAVEAPRQMGEERLNSGPMSAIPIPGFCCAVWRRFTSTQWSSPAKSR